MSKEHARRYPRLNVSLPVDYSVGRESFQSVTLSMGGGGLFLKGAKGLEPGSDVTLRFRPVKRRPTVQAKAIVRYRLAEMGAAVEFTDISADDRQRLLRLIHEQMGDRRLLARAPLATQVECNHSMTLAFSRNVSLAGMFIETAHPLPAGASLTVRFNLDNKDKVVTAHAQVAYELENMGMGILFTEIDPAGRDALVDYLAGSPVQPGNRKAKSNFA